MSLKNKKIIWSKFGSPSNNSTKLLLEPMGSSSILLADSQTNGDNIAFDDYSFDAINSTSKVATAVTSTGKTKTMSLALEVRIQNKWYSA